MMGRSCCLNNGQSRTFAYDFDGRMTFLTDIDDKVFANESLAFIGPLI